MTSGLHIHVHTHACTTLVHVYIHMYVHTHTHTNCWMIQPVFIDSLAVSYIYSQSMGSGSLAVKPLIIFPKEMTTVVDTTP